MKDLMLQIKGNPIRRRSFAWALIGLLLLTACNLADDPALERAQRLRHQAEEIEIAVVLSAGEPGSGFRQGMELALADQAKAAGGPRLQVHYHELKSPSDGIRTAHKLAKNPRLAAVFSDERNARTVATIYQYYGILYFNLADTDPEMTGPAFPLVFQLVPHDLALAARTVAWASHQAADSLLLIYQQDNLFRRQVDTFHRLAVSRQLRIDPASGFFTPYKPPRFDGELQRLLETPLAENQVAFLIGHHEALPQLIGKLPSGGRFIINNFFLQSLPSDLSDQASYFLPCLFDSGSDLSPAAVDFTKNFVKQYGSQPGLQAALAADALALFRLGIKAAASPEPDKVAAQIKNLTSFSGLTGVFAFVDGGRRLLPATMSLVEFSAGREKKVYSTDKL